MLRNYNPLRVVFLGTPEFAVESLKALVNAGVNVVGVVTVPDKPAGRGYKLQKSAVKVAAEELNLPLAQPENLKDESFLNLLQEWEVNLAIVVAFRKLPEEVWKLPEHGTFNLHGSLLPNYRGAAPINWAVMNGELETGVTTFFINDIIDTGAILKKASIAIGENDNVGMVYQQLMEVGAGLVVETVADIADGKAQAIPQDEEEASRLKPAPKIFRATCKIDWSESVAWVHNRIRGLSPYPAAFAELLEASGKTSKVKIFESLKSNKASTYSVGDILVEKDELYVACSDGMIQVLSIQPEGKRRMKTADYLRGKDLAGCKFC